VGDLLDKRLVVVMGKGGVGRTTVAAALGLLATRRGRRAVLCEPGGPGRAADLAPGLTTVSIEPESAKLEWLERQLRSRRVARLLGRSRIFELRVFPAPGRLGVRLFGHGAGVLFAAMRRATGIDLLEDLSEFFRSFGDMSRGFRERADRVRGLLAGSRTAFVLVTSPRRRAIAEAMEFRRRILDAGLPFGGVVVNRVHVVEPSATAAGLGELADQELAEKVAESLADNRRLADGDHANPEPLRRRLGRRPMIEVPELDDDVHDLDGLRRVDGYLFAGHPA
jgi:CobQ/CobB/MinD/ParA nucleotide binding domain